MVPANLVRLRTFNPQGREIRETDAVCVFQEGADVAYDTLVEDAYYQEAVLPSIDLQRDVKRARFKQAGRFQAIRSAAAAFYPFMGLAIMGIIVLWAILGGGR